MKITHIINPVKVNKASDLFLAQPVTFRTMLKAKNDSKYKNQINQYVVGFEEDYEIFPLDFITLPNLRTSVLDTNTFEKQRKLPLISEILYSLKDIDADYIIYTNVDIAVLPFFYDYIFSKIEKGSDSLIINRRVVGEIDEDATMFAVIGESHPGYDCFVFRKELLNQFVFGNICIGANFIGRAMYANLITFSDKLEIIKNVHVTFHIGDDGAWLANDYSEFDLHNKKEVINLITQLIKCCKTIEIKEQLVELIDFVNEYGVVKIDSKSKSKKSLPIIRKLKKIVKIIID